MRFITATFSALIFIFCLTGCEDEVANKYRFRIFCDNHKWDLQIVEGEKGYFLLAANPKIAPKYDVLADGEIYYDAKKIGRIEQSIPYYAEGEKLEKLGAPIKIKEFLVRVDYGHQPELKSEEYLFVDALLKIDRRKK